MLVTSSAMLAALAVGAQAQAAAYTDPNTGITFQGFTESKGFQFGLALPTNPTTEFIAQIVSPLTSGAGWGGVSLNNAMVGHLLVTAWPNGQSVMASFRKATAYASPAVYAGNATMAPIAAGTFVNSTHVSFTFVCTNCMSSDGTAFRPTDTQALIGWAMSSTAVVTPADPATVLTFHAAGFGMHIIPLAAAKSADYAAWSAKAGTPSASLGGSASTNSTGGTTNTNKNTTTTTSNSTYDYIVAGAGASGIIVAQRLAESGASVLLIERGNASTYASGGRSQVTSWNSTVTQYDVPALAYYLDISAAYCTDTASNAGCLLGGSTMVNAMMFIRPQQRDFDDKWPSGWKWSNVKAASERLYARNPGSILPSKDQKYYDTAAYSVMSTFLTTGGWKSVNALKSPGEKTKIFSRPPWDTINGLRGGPVTSYLPLAKKLPNFKLLLLTHVVQALRNGSTVTGVLTKDTTGAQQIINLKAGGALILASGALSSPRILFNSGIGPADQLSIVANGTTGVKLPDQSQWIDLPVGSNLKDHPVFTLNFVEKQNSTTSLLQKDFTSPSQTNIDLFKQGSGPLAQSGQRLSFWTSINSSNTGYRYFQGTCNSPSPGTIRIKAYLTHGLNSVGRLGITAAGATTFVTKPWFTTKEDTTALVDFSNDLLKMSRASASPITSPTYKNETLVTEADLLSSFASGSHFVGTAKMQTQANDKNAVVDANTKVLGMQNLFVVDASIHPDLPTGNTQAIVMIVAEQAAERILALKKTPKMARKL